MLVKSLVEESFKSVSCQMGVIWMLMFGALTGPGVGVIWTLMFDALTGPGVGMFWTWCLVPLQGS